MMVQSVEHREWSGSQAERPPSWFRLVVEQGHVDDEVLNWKYNGSGTEDDPYAVVWMDNDSRNREHFFSMQSF